jgi:hypothetical protein
LILLAGHGFGQDADSSISPKKPFMNESVKEKYLKKSENKKQAAQILLISGTALTIGGVFVASNKSDNFFITLGNVLIGGFMMTVGIISDLVSIPFFIRSATLKKKAATISLTPEKINMPAATSGKELYVPSVSVKIPL